VVITKGSGRIAEVAARFSLDAMPGKQMAIDADLSAGLIDEKEAKLRRKTIEAESNFFGAMDGASKFVRGDAIAALIITGINLVGGIIMAIREDLGLSWLIAVTVPVLAVLLGFIISRMVPSFRLMQARIDEVNRLLREQITGVRVVRAFVREPLETERFATANQDLTTVAIRAGRWQALMFPTVMLVANVASVAVLWFGAHRVDSGQIEIGALIAFLSYLMQILVAIMMVTFIS